MAGSWALNGFAMFSMIEKESGRWVGRTGPWQPEGWPGTEVGWGLLRSAWGHGYAMEAAVASIDWAFEELGWTDVIHCIDPANTPSQKLAERLGSRNRGPGKLPAPFDSFPVEVWGQSKKNGRRAPRDLRCATNDVESNDRDAKT
jgi:RimJ/RimL family protein N-acetyltransferase